MFPIPFNFPFRKSNGDISTIGAEINAGGGGSSYTLPTASAETKGGVKIGLGLSMDGEVLNNSNPTPYTLPTASAETKGGVKVGTGLSINENGVLSASGGGGGLSYIDYDIPQKSYSSGLNTNSLWYSETTLAPLKGKDIISVVCRQSSNMYFNVTLGNVNPGDTATTFSITVYNTSDQSRTASIPVRIYYM